MIEQPKPQTFTHEQIERGLRGFLLTMRRGFVTRHPGEDVRVPDLENIAPADRSLLLKAMGVALSVATRAPLESTTSRAQSE